MLSLLMDTNIYIKLDRDPTPSIENIEQLALRNVGLLARVCMVDSVLLVVSLRVSMVYPRSTRWMYLFLQLCPFTPLEHTNSQSIYVEFRPH